MKTRIIKTRIWSDDKKFPEMSPLAKLGFLYYITNERIGMTGIYECPDRIASFDIGVTVQQLKKIQAELSENLMVKFFDGWVYVVNAEKHNNYKKGEKNIIAYNREKNDIPSHILSTFNTTMDSTIHTHLNTETLNHKSKIRNKKPETATVILTPEQQRAYAFLNWWNTQFGKRYSNYDAIADNLAYWLTKYTPDEIVFSAQKMKSDAYWKNIVDPVKFLRKGNPRGEKVDHIGEYLNGEIIQKQAQPLW